jgi:GTP-binding protein EngB required for normal cell division
VPNNAYILLSMTSGKSSLLNSLLEEASVLPTSGSRGCTAAVVELMFHSDLIKQAANPDEKVPVYRGEVEFITLADWQKELKVLVDECSTQENTIYQLPPKADVQPDAAAAWQKIEQVYGKGYMDMFAGRPTAHVFNTLANDLQVKKLLTSTEPGKEYNSIVVNVGEVAPGSDDVKELLKPFHEMKGKTRSTRKKYATDFRNQINNYVYRSGNGNARQTWPLIHKVELRGPWHVLSTGACLVDLPGVRDSNAARAKVAERYLQNCNQIAIVASIKRAVDDGTAKELMGEQFKRRLLMDGNYGNVFFICTQTDDLEATETMRDHQDIAEEVPGRWEKMCDLSRLISSLETQINKKMHEKEELEIQIDDIKQDIKDSLVELKEAEEEAEECKEDGDDYDRELLNNLKDSIAARETDLDNAKEVLTTWTKENQDALDETQAKCDGLQKKLKVSSTKYLS